MKNHIVRWNKWRKKNVNSTFHKLLVLLKLRYSPTFENTFTDEEEEKFFMAFQNGIKEGERMWKEYERLHQQK